VICWHLKYYNKFKHNLTGNGKVQFCRQTKLADVPETRINAAYNKNYMSIAVSVLIAKFKARNPDFHRDGMGPNLRLRRYELVILAAVMALSCRYCLLAHGAILIKSGISVDKLRLILTIFNET
jgi:AhpD family alkylhydroperoxidase